MVFRETYAFHEWARERILQAAGRLSQERLRRPGLVPGGNEDGSLHATLAHMAEAEVHWLARWTGDADHRQQSGLDLPDLPAIARAWERADAGIAALLASSPDLDLPVRYFRQAVNAYDEQPLWQQLLHVSKSHDTP